MLDVTGAYARFLSETRACRVCGCTDDNACAHPGGRPCSWVTPPREPGGRANEQSFVAAGDLCSVCAVSIGELMRELAITDAEAERMLAAVVAIEALRNGMPVPEFRRAVNGGAGQVSEDQRDEERK